MVRHYKQIIKKYFDEHSFVDSNIKSYDNFVQKGLQRIVNEVGDIIPTVIPEEVDEFKIKLDKIWVDKPHIVEADGSKRKVYPTEARLRKITYSIPMYLEVSAHINGIKRETFTTEIGKLPVMLKSKYCHLSGLKRDELIKHGEDPDDPGGYFILNGNERVLITVEDLTSNKFFVDKSTTGPSLHNARIFSEHGAYKIPHLMEQMKDGVIYLSFTRFKRIPIMAVIKALGLISDQEITNFISQDKQYDDIFINLLECTEIKNQDDALEFLAKKGNIIATAKDQRIDKTLSELDKYLLPNFGTSEESRMMKAYNLCKFIRKFLLVVRDNIPLDDRDHYMNKRLRLSGDLLTDLFRVNLRILVNDMLYNFQRLVKRGKFHSIRIIIRDKLLTSRIKSAMATGSWVGGRKGVSQNIDRTNFLASSSHLQRIVSLLSTTQENFEARALHCTHWGRLCPVETPEGTPIGLRKNLALLTEISQLEFTEDKMKKLLEANGLKFVGKK